MLLRIVFAVLLACWPLLVYVSYPVLGHWPLLIAGALLLAWRLPQARGLAMLAAAVLIGLGLLGQAELGMRSYPVAVNLVMLLVFAGSLIKGPPLIEQLARLREPDLPPRAIAYTRRVTQAWCGFFLANGSVAAWTAWQASFELWALYNGVIGYLLIGAMFAAEWIIRRRVRQETP